jgi:hypothetical protein
MSRHRIYRQLGCYLRKSHKIPAKGETKGAQTHLGRARVSGPSPVPRRPRVNGLGPKPVASFLESAFASHRLFWGEFVISPPPGFLEIKGQTVQPRSHGPAQPRESPVLTRDGKTFFCFFFFFLCYYYYFMLFHYYFAAFHYYFTIIPPCFTIFSNCFQEGMPTTCNCPSYSLFFFFFANTCKLRF